MPFNSSLNSSAGIYKKELTEYDLNRTPHTQQTGEDDQLLKRSDLIDTLSSEFLCPICLDLLTNTMVTECLHRFCAECIKKSIYKGNRQCPTCRRKIISKRNLRPDPNMDKLIEIIWPDRQLYEAMQHERTQKWNKLITVEGGALQRSIVETMQSKGTQSHRRQPNTTTNGGKMTVEKSEEVEQREKNKAKKALLSNCHDSGCATAKKLCLRPPQQMTETVGFESDSVDLSSSSSEGEDSFYEPTSDEEEEEQLAHLPKRLVVEVDTSFLNKNKNCVDDKFIGQLNKQTKRKETRPNVTVADNEPPLTLLDDDSSGVWSASSSSSSPNPPIESRSSFSFPTLTDCTFNFRIGVSMESAMREYVSKTGQLGLITIVMAPLCEHRPVVERFLVKLMHRATVGELRDTIVSTHKNLAKAELNFFIRSYRDANVTRLHAAESLCTVLALARRPNFFDYPTVFFAYDERPSQNQFP